jgi:hypothetical protein
LEIDTVIETTVIRDVDAIADYNKRREAERKKQETKERRAARDKFALVAMESLIRVYSTVGDSGLSQSTGDSDFVSLAGEATREGWMGLQGTGYSYAEYLSQDAYAIAEAMMTERSRYDRLEESKHREENNDEEETETTEKAESAANQSGRGNDGSTVLGVPAVEPAAGESQVGSDQQACAECLQETKPE